MDHPTAGRRVLSPEQIDRSMAELAPDALACVERALRGTTRPNKVVMDTAFRVLDLARDYTIPEIDAPEVAELRNVLSLVGGE
tara:strand:+ start:1062 stop:1310 length:249 start_codon:yes stop_codon:yes gene_type:complete